MTGGMFKHFDNVLSGAPRAQERSLIAKKIW